MQSVNRLSSVSLSLGQRPDLPGRKERVEEGWVVEERDQHASL